MHSPISSIFTWALGGYLVLFEWLLNNMIQVLEAVL